MNLFQKKSGIRRLILTTLFVVTVTISVCQGQNNMLLNNKNSRYDNVLVYIDENVPEQEGLLKNIKDSLTAASRALWTATADLDNMKAPHASPVQLGTVFISVPGSWQQAAQPLTWQQCTKAHFFVAKTANDGNNAAAPFTKQLGKCGTAGQFTRFYDHFFRSNTDLKLKGKVIMAEFAKLRYGVFSEAPYRKMLTYFSGETISTSTCASHIDWKVNRNLGLCMIPNDECEFIKNSNQNHKYSVMFDLETNSSEYFCNDGDRKHNQFAPSIHNIKCQGRSVSSVILDHSDFKITRSREVFQEPTFTIVKSQSRKLVLVLDISGSMSGAMGDMKIAAKAFVEEVIEDSAEVGLVVFNNYASILNNLTPLTSTLNRQALVNKINSINLGGTTNIPDSLDKAVQVLGGNIRDTKSVMGTIILLSDGGNNRQVDDYPKFIEAIISKGVVVNVVSYGTAGDVRMGKLARGSNGNFLFANKNNFMALLNVFSKRQSCELAINNTMLVMELELSISLTGIVINTDLFYIDEFIGIDVEFDINLPTAVANYLIQVISPNGKLYSTSKTTQHSQGVTLKFRISGSAMSGTYRLRMHTPTSRTKRQANQIKVQVTVTSRSSSNATRQIRPTGQLSSSEVTLMDSSTEVTAHVDLTTCGLKPTETVVVTLTLTTENGVKTNFNMTDNGLGPDTLPGDGIFSSAVYAKNLRTAGLFTFTALVHIKTVNGDAVQRSVNLGSLRILDVAPGLITDKIAPSKIEFIKVTVSNVTKKIIALEFSAPGNDEMHGEISHYEVMVSWSDNRSVIKNESLTNKVPALTPVTLQLDLMSDNVSSPFRVAVRGVDPNGNTGQWSQAKIHNWNFAEIVSSLSSNSGSTQSINRCSGLNFVFIFVSMVLIQ